MYLLETNDIIEDKHLSEWKYDAYQCFVEKITNKQLKFPCIPATQGFALGQFKYGFTGNPMNKNTPSEVANILKEYALCYPQSGNYSSLIIFFDKLNDEPNPNTTLDYEKIFWKILNEVSEFDEIEWPSDIPKSPAHPLWEYCFHGERFFIYCATPSHEKRLSRQFPYLMLAITPRLVFEQFELLHSAKHIKSKIRERLIQYDSISPHPDLKKYGNQDNSESKQYFLRDDQTTLSQCPFHKK
ncbi:hypothetical protein GH741_13780 [Aquibacillus halophilus]|uniref:YqcI/YcgG family protein n=1 Tax=Aquibacillus halophilus TaxID=930132 RepID=A0A6A8DDI2_9BACI|nr:hypothetical protein [Aquibacillus halophilus]